MSLNKFLKNSRNGKSFSAKALAFGGIGAAISLLAVTAAFYLQNLSLTFNLVAMLGVLLPLSKRYYKEAVLVVVAVTGIGAIYTTVHILPFLLVTGSYTIFAVFSYEKNLKLWMSIPVAVVWSSFVFCILYYVTKILYLDLDSLHLADMNKGLLYFLFNLIFSAGFVVYHFATIWVYKYVSKLTAKIK